MSRPRGLPKTGGRKPGAANRRTREIADAAAARGQTPLEYMLAVMTDPTADPARRDDMAKAAAPYMHARLANIEAKVEVDAKVEQVTHEERRARAIEAIDIAFREVERAADDDEPLQIAAE